MAQTTVIEDQLCAWLKTIPAVEAIDGAVFPFGGVPENVTFPYVTFCRVSGKRLNWLRARGGVGLPVIQIDCFGLSYGSAKNLANAIRLVLDGFNTALNGKMGTATVQVALVEDDWDSEEPSPHGDGVTQYRTSMEVCIWFKEIS